MPDITDCQVTEAMQVFGGSFVRCLGELAQRADGDNYRRLKAAFPELWEEYREIARSRRIAAESAVR